ncbi:ATP synthase F1 subunit delta (plasmid) [Legionella adelaidensis]|uniref:ATP synthase subunit delta n=1 Tax=Legionella adelaidensis TaxID=45056 RepID=A0A0W0R189_9GAMM|nr:F0F1 ATP synthase subunit delta [Legionella adelaidensis]KTC64860.1 ATP synthase F1 subunit delta [Legionella adelaidensis]VEH82969.1 ATP synthase F1 subunit delta [Legionella adelaidensis]
MSDNTTIARPYAKAVFEYAENAKQLSAWSGILQNLADITQNPDIREFIENPATSKQQQIKLVSELLAKLNKESSANEAVGNFIQMLAQNKRLPILTDISVQFEILRAEQEKTMAVTVISFSPLSASQEKNLTDSLQKRLQRKVSLDISIDPALLGGAVIYAGDLVIDGSVRGRLNKLESDLAA